MHAQEFIRALREEEIPPTLGELLLANHLAEVSPPYQRALLTARQRVADSYLEHLLGLWCHPESRTEALATARRHLDLLLALPDHRDRCGKVERATVRFTSPALVALLVAEARAAVSADPHAAFESAELALTVARHRGGLSTVAALAAAHAGNARRAAGELTEARPYFDRANRYLDVAPDPDPWLLAEVASLEGSLLKDRGRLDSAEKRLLDARDTFENAGDRCGAARVRIKLSAVRYLAGHPERAVVVLYEALDQLRGLTEPKLVVGALHNLVLYQTELGNTRRARTLLRFLQLAYDWYPEFEKRHVWLEGRLEWQAGCLDDAEHHFRDALAQFVTSGASFDAALVALDLAEVLVATARAGEVVTVTRPLPPLFRRQGVEREATAAIVLFHKTARQGRITRRLLTELRAFLEVFSRDRSARFPATRTRR